MEYDEFGYFAENAAEYDLAFDTAPVVERVEVALPDGRALRGLRWGTNRPEVVLIHGGAQNAHTWDTVALAFDRPLLALDLPGHGHSDWRADQAYSIAANADDIAYALHAFDLAPIPVVGMSMGGLTALGLLNAHPDLVARLMLVDVTPGVDGHKAEPIVAFVSGPSSFASFEAILARTIEHNPTRSESSLRRGVLHNARPMPDGTWEWRYDRLRYEGSQHGTVPNFEALWNVVSDATVPLWLARGARSTVVSDDDVAELLRRAPAARVDVFDHSGHSIQGDQPVEFAALLAEFVDHSP